MRIHKPAIMRSKDRRLGARLRPRFRMRAWCRIKTDSATTARTPPGCALRMMVTIACRKRVKMSRMVGMVSNSRSQESNGLVEFAYDRRFTRLIVSGAREKVMFGRYELNREPNLFS